MYSLLIFYNHHVVFINLTKIFLPLLKIFIYFQTVFKQILIQIVSSITQMCNVFSWKR